MASALAQQTLLTRDDQPTPAVHLSIPPLQRHFFHPPLLIREACSTHAVARVADTPVFNLAQGCRKQVPSCVSH